MPYQYPKEPPPNPRSMPFSYEVSVVRQDAELRILRRLARALGFSAELVRSPRGLSGITHADVLLGKRQEDRHAVIFQSGFDRCLGTELPPRLKGLGHSLTSDTRPLDVREEETRREVLFAAYDLKASLENAGWTCDIVYFINLHSPEDHGFSLSKRLLDTLGPSLGHVPLITQVTGGASPVTAIPVAALEQSALATGSSLIKLSDLSAEEVIELASPNIPERDPLHIGEILRRVGVHQFFRPPVDELMLGTLAETELSWSEKELVLAGEISKNLKHEPARSNIFPDTELEDFVSVVSALRDHKFLDVEGKYTRLTETGNEMVLRIKNKNQQSWHKRVSGIVDLVKKVIGLGGLIA